MWCRSVVLLIWGGGGGGYCVVSFGCFVNMVCGGRVTVWCLSVVSLIWCVCVWGGHCVVSFGCFVNIVCVCVGGGGVLCGVFRLFC